MYSIAYVVACGKEDRRIVRTRFEDDGGIFTEIYRMDRIQGLIRDGRVAAVHGLIIGRRPVCRASPGRVSV